ncbi:DNA-deoxyinosine glycosylase [Mycolicibacterium sarraceniae]|uniref:DNA-deoxyinosine glycosylase n=1 Tax=Mycolicibacterium sarraceniae TaxID=1534348 RepID=A0A7I7SUL9_9MYCO|nr:DNA-deoxyinosine glycosylase [Mycolicibacterium sarraceniae]BBY59745.1 DNA-deoxyinosine glycosylase [Mycolicibacterium sarraceniae]
MSQLPLLQGFSPIIGDRPGTPILGKMPSVMSLATGEYYSNPRDVFWHLASELFDFDANDPYAQRSPSLCGSGIAVWDVLKQCRRPGSLDSAVERDSMVANDFATLFAEHPSTSPAQTMRYADKLAA